MDLQRLQRTRLSFVVVESAVFLILVQVAAGLLVGALERPAPPPPPPVGSFAKSPPGPQVVSRRPAPLSRARLQRLIARASHGTARLLAASPGPGRLTTILVRVHHAPLALLTDGRYLFLGPVFGAAGHNLQKRAQARMADNALSGGAGGQGLVGGGLAPTTRTAPTPAPVSGSESPASSLPAQRVLSAPAHAQIPPAVSAISGKSFPSSANTGFVVGRSGPLLTFVADPNCAYCHAMWVQVLWPMIQSGHLRVRVVPVGIVDPRNAIVRAAAILAAPDPARAWIANEQRFHVARERGGWPAPGRFDPARPRQHAIIANTAAFFAAEGGSVATPTLFFHGRTHVGTLTSRAFRRFLSP